MKQVRHEEQVHQTHLKTLSIDGAGLEGKFLREMQDPTGLNINVIVPPKVADSAGLFTPEHFIQNETRDVVTCPAGQISCYHQRDNRRHATVYRFDRKTCLACPLLSKCMAKLPKQQGRTVQKNDYEIEHRRVREQALTEEYRAIRKEHPKVERKISELVRRHGARRARVRGLLKVCVQLLLTCLVVNIKRFIRQAPLQFRPAVA